MREIKFRAWDKTNKRLICDGISLDMSDCSRHAPHIRNRTCPVLIEIMQYTGLKDRNGKEIYEGDILRPYIANGQITDGLVKYKNGCFIVEPIGGERFYTDCLGLLRPIFEIIGNVFENPELLSDTHPTNTAQTS